MAFVKFPACTMHNAKLRRNKPQGEMSGHLRIILMYQQNVIYGMTRLLTFEASTSDPRCEAISLEQMPKRRTAL